MNIKIVLIFALVGVLTSCGNKNRVINENSSENVQQSTKDESSSIMYVGVLSKSEFTFYQYGTHQLRGSVLDGSVENIDKERTFALKSDKIDLNEWIGKDVIITGKKIKGYPVEGGPDYINVIKIEENKELKKY